MTPGVDRVDLARRADALARRLPAFARHATAFTGPLEATLREFNPLLAYHAPYKAEWGAIFGGARGATEVYDAVGHITRVGLVTTKSGPVGLVTPEQDQALFAEGVLRDADTRGYNAYPAPGGLLTPQPGSGSYQRVERDPAYR